MDEEALYAACFGPIDGCTDAPYGQFPNETFNPACTNAPEVVTDEARENVMLYGEGSISAITEGTAAVCLYLHNNDQCAGEQIERSKTIQCSVVSVDEPNDFTFTRCPNPAKEQLNLSYNKILDRVEVLNILRQVVMTQSVNAVNAHIDISNLPSGNYVVKASSVGTVLTTKIVK